MTMETRRGGRKKTRMGCNRYGDDFLFDKIRPDEIGADLVIMSDLASEKEWKIINDSEHTSDRRIIVCQKEKWI